MFSAPRDQDGDCFKLLEFIFSPPESLLFDFNLHEFVLFTAVPYYRTWDEINNALHNNQQVNLFDFLSLVKTFFQGHISLASKEQAAATSNDEEMRSLQDTHSIDIIHEIICISTNTVWDEGGSSLAGIATREGTSFWPGINNIHPQCQPKLK